MPVDELGQHRDQRHGLGLVALEQVHRQWKPACIGEQPETDLRVDPPFLAQADLAQPVPAWGLEVERAVVVEHQSQSPVTGRAPVAGLGDHRSVVAGDDAFEAAHERHPRRRADAELVEDADGVQLAGRLDDPCEYECSESLVTDRAEPERVIHPAQRLPQDQRAGRVHDRCTGIGWLRRGQVDLQRLLVGVQALFRRLQQQRQLVLVVGRSDVVDPEHGPAALVHDLHRGRARGRLHPAHERPHPARLPTDPPRLVTTLAAEPAGQRPVEPMITP